MHISSNTWLSGVIELIGVQGRYVLPLLKVSRTEIFRRSNGNTLMGQLWHLSGPKKATMLMWLILHKGLLVGTRLVQMGLDGVCKICETHEHYLKNCWMAKYA